MKGLGSLGLLFPPHGTYQVLCQRFEGHLVVNWCFSAPRVALKGPPALPSAQPNPPLNDAATPRAPPPANRCRKYPPIDQASPSLSGGPNGRAVPVDCAASAVQKSRNDSASYLRTNRTRAAGDSHAARALMHNMFRSNRTHQPSAYLIPTAVCCASCGINTSR